MSTRLAINLPSGGGLRALRRSDGRLTLDLTAARFFEPFEVATIVCQVQAASVRGDDLEVLMPVDYNCRAYLQRMDLFERIRELGFDDCADPHPGQGRRDLSDSLYECSRIDEEGSIGAFIDMVVQRLDSAGVDPRDVTDELTLVLWEIAGNVIEHAQVDHGYVVAQTYPQKGRFKWAVSDGGVGIGHYQPGVPDGEAIRRAVADGFTTAAKPRGKGFTHLRRIAEKLSGNVRVRSGTGTLKSSSADDDPWMRDGLSHLQGTVVAADIKIM